MEQKVGVKETQELALGAIALGFYVAKLMKDGFQVSDVASFIDKLKADPEFAAKLEAAYKGIEHVPGEVKDIDLAEGLQLAMVVVPAVVAELGNLK